MGYLPKGMGYLPPESHVRLISNTMLKGNA
jgi:hypothetical protein